VAFQGSLKTFLQQSLSQTLYSGQMGSKSLGYLFVGPTRTLLTLVCLQEHLGVADLVAGDFALLD
jgi:hypothetical protein